MFITRKRFNKLTELIDENSRLVNKNFEEVDQKLTSLAEALGYEYVSEAVKEDEMGTNQSSPIGLGGILTWPYEVKVGEKAVLKYSWKKMEPDVVKNGLIGMLQGVVSGMPPHTEPKKKINPKKK